MSEPGNGPHPYPPQGPQGGPPPGFEPPRPPAQPFPAQPFPPQPVPVLDPARVTALPIEERSSSSFYRAPRWSWWRPVLALLLALFIMAVVAVIGSIAGLIGDRVDLAEIARTGVLPVGPWLFLSNNVTIALAVPVAFLVHRLLFGQAPGFLSSVVGRFRWGWFGRCVAIALPIWVAQLVIEIALTGLPPGFGPRPYTVLMIVGILLTTPFQCAGEEYLVRGLLQRLVASYFPWETVGFVAGAVVTTLTFVAIHGAGDPWLNAFYAVFGAVTAWLTWRTGGLEAAVALHVVNNMVQESLLPFIDFTGIFDREAGAGSPWLLVNMAVFTATAVLLWWLAKRRGLVRTSAPGREELARAQAAAASVWGRPAYPPLG